MFLFLDILFVLTPHSRAVLNNLCSSPEFEMLNVVLDADGVHASGHVDPVIKLLLFNLDYLLNLRRVHFPLVIL